jgi:hypothetical protein
MNGTTAQAVWIALLAASSLGSAAAQQRETRMEITVERKEGQAWKAVDPALVLASGDVVRFKFKPSFDGYLYVTDYGTSGKYTLLFPRQETGQKNLVTAGNEYLIPATGAVFRVSGPAGYESVYWYISPVALGTFDLTPSRPPTHRPPILLPRCDDTAMRARGLCLDAQAGPRQINETDKLPDDLTSVRRGASRELTILQEENQMVVSAAGPATAPLLYEFRLAHK